MLRETYLAIMNRIPEDAIPIVVTRRVGHALSPSWRLLNDYNDGKIDWMEYTRRFYLEMDNDYCREMMRQIKKLSETKDVYLVCFEKPPKNCHRYLLIDMITNLDK